MLTLNIFGDIEGTDSCSNHYPEFANNPKWRALEKIYTPIVKKLRNEIQKQRTRKLTVNQAEHIEDVIYDGSDAYDDVEVEYLNNVYKAQIDVVRGILRI